MAKHTNKFEHGEGEGRNGVMEEWSAEKMER